MKFKERLVRAFCRHPELKFISATGAELLGDGGNVEVGLLARCPTCKRTWTGEVRAGCPEAYGHLSRSRVVIPAAPRFKMGSTPRLHSDVSSVRRLCFTMATITALIAVLLFAAYWYAPGVKSGISLNGSLFLLISSVFAMTLTRPSTWR